MKNPTHHFVKVLSPVINRLVTTHSKLHVVGVCMTRRARKEEGKEGWAGDRGMNRGTDEQTEGGR